jgi:aspartate carbamoyltransferase catalytic subunit
VEWEESSDLLEVASKCDVVYQTRIQKERFGENINLYEEARGKYIVNKDVLKVMQNHAVVMHPLPRLDEVSTFDHVMRYIYLHSHSHYGIWIPSVRGSHIHACRTSVGSKIKQ